jgi:hypothetical protein
MRDDRDRRVVSGCVLLATIVAALLDARLAFVLGAAVLAICVVFAVVEYVCRDD